MTVFTPRTALLAGAALCAAGALLLLRRRRSQEGTSDRSGAPASDVPAAHVFELKGQYYQCLGHAWDHEVKDFKVVYRPLYHCVAKPDSYEAHTLAVSHFSRWDARFTPVPVDALPADARALLLPGPFTLDPEWQLPALTAPSGCCGPSRSGLGTRAHEPPPGARLLHENPRLRIYDLRLAAGTTVTVRHAHPTVRWQVLAPTEATPMPRFYAAGDAATVPHTPSDVAGPEFREIVFEILREPSLTEQQVQRLLATSRYSTDVGSALMLENAHCRAWDFRLPPGGGDRRALHHHRLPYAFVFLGPGRLNVYRPGAGAGDVEWVCPLERGDGDVVWSPIANGGCEADGAPAAPAALHSVDNAVADAPFREYLIELK